MNKMDIKEKITKLKNLLKINKKKKSISKEKFSTREVIVIMFITCIVTTSFFLLVFYINPTDKVIVVNEGDSVDEISKEFNYIKNNFYKNIDDSILINGAIKGMTEALGDDYSEVIDESDFDTYNIILEGEYNGIGVQIANTDKAEIIITAVCESAPAGRAGLEVGDIITKIDGDSLTGKTAKDLGNLIKVGKNKTNV